MFFSILIFVTSSKYIGYKKHSRIVIVLPFAIFMHLSCKVEYKLYLEK